MTAGRLILHVGLPKAASSALQVWADANRAALAARGVDYPDPRSAHLMRKHPALVAELTEGRADTLAADVAASRCPTILVSNEGLVARYPRFGRGAGAALRAAAAGRAITLLVMTRERTAWMRSLWAQAVLNPPMANLPPEAAPFEVFAARPSVAWLADLLGVDPAVLPPPPRTHEAAPAHAVEIVRRINALDPDRPARLRAALFFALQEELSTGNVTLANTARVFAGRPQAQQRHAWGDLARALARVAPDPGAMAALHAALSARAAAGRR